MILNVHDEGNPRYVTLRGARLSDWLRGQGIPAVRSRIDKGYLLHRDRLADALAAAQESGVKVRLRGGR